MSVLTDAYVDDDQLFALIQSHTSCSQARLENLARLCNQLNQKNVSCDFTECGTYRGGSAAVLSRYLNSDRHPWLYNSFQGLPSTSAKDGEDTVAWVGKRAAEVADVQKILIDVSASLERCHIQPG